MKHPRASNSRDTITTSRSEGQGEAAVRAGAMNASCPSRAWKKSAISSTLARWKGWQRGLILLTFSPPASVSHLYLPLAEPNQGVQML